jgi:hypothetical protein
MKFKAAFDILKVKTAKLIKIVVNKMFLMLEGGPGGSKCLKLAQDRCLIVI